MNYINFWGGVFKGFRAKVGVSILVKKAMKNKITDWEFVNERIIMIDMILYAREMSIVGLYAPTNDATTVEKDKL
jgi:hypothetical protein